MGKERMKIGTDNIVIRQLLTAIGTSGDSGVLRRASKLNTVVEVALKDAKAIALRVGDGSSKDMAGKTMAMVREFDM